MPSMTVAASCRCNEPRTLSTRARVCSRSGEPSDVQICDTHGRCARADSQDDAVQRQPPQPAGTFDNPRVPEKLGQKAPDRGRGRGVGGAEVHQQHACGGGAAVFVSRFAQVEAMHRPRLREKGAVVWPKRNENCISIVEVRNRRRRALKWKPAHKSGEKRRPL